MSKSFGAIKLPSEQEAIRARCVHPTGTFIEFKKEDIEQSIPKRFEKIVARYPDRIAVRTRNNQVSYDELNRAANRLAHLILSQHGNSQEPIALFFAKSPGLIAAILGVLKAGKIYVLLDPALPDSRINLILEHSQAVVVVTDDEHLSLITEKTGENRQIINIDELVLSPETGNPVVSISPDAPAWIHYTSGSTGEPKGVVQTHRNALHVVMLHTNDYHICSSDRVTFLASRGGDIFMALLNGASVVPVDLKKEGLADLAELLIQEEITVYGSVVSTFRHFVSDLVSDDSGTSRFPRLRLLKLIGEPVYKKDVELYRKHFSPECILVNRLGGTETGTFCHYFIDHTMPISDSVMPVGYALDDMEILLLGEGGPEVNIGEIGEMAVKSSYLSPGYWRRPDLTEKAFLPDPEVRGTRIYLIGDLGRRLPNGCLVHLGRKDFQVKIRGNRVETAEVEMALLALGFLKEVVVVGADNSSGNKRLVAYIVPSDGRVPAISQIRKLLAETLPDYMIPSAFVTMDKLPLAGIGKVSRRALPDPGMSRPDLGTPYAGPATPVEAQLERIWAEVLSLDRVGVHDNFFDLGGHSLAATRVVTHVIRQFQLEIPLQSLFQSPTVAEMAAVIAENQAKNLDKQELDRILSDLELLSDDQAKQRLIQIK